MDLQDNAIAGTPAARHGKPKRLSSVSCSSVCHRDMIRVIPDFRQMHPERRRHIILDEIRISDIDFDTES